MKTNHKTNLVVNTIDCVILVTLGVFSFCYSFFWSSFAELHIQFAFLDFPIFVGELLLAFCLVMLLIKWNIEKIPFEKWHYLLGIYMMWVLIKALGGYFSFGPLSFRNAAMFYYPLFAVVGFYIYRKSQFNQIVIYAILIFTIVVKIWSNANANLEFVLNNYYSFPYLMLSCILIWKLNKKWPKFLFLILLSFIYPFKAFFIDSKSLMIGVVLAVVFLAAALLFISTRIKKRIKFLIIISIFSFFIAGFMRYTDASKKNALTTPLKFIEHFKTVDQYVENSKENYVPRPLSVSLYDKDRKSISLAFYEEKNKIYPIEKVRRTLLSAENPRAAAVEIRKVIRTKFAKTQHGMYLKMKKIERLALIRIKTLIKDVSQQNEGIRILEISKKKMAQIINTEILREEKETLEKFLSYLNEQKTYDPDKSAAMAVELLDDMSQYSDAAAGKALKFIGSDEYAALFGFSPDDILADEAEKMMKTEEGKYSFSFHRNYFLTLLSQLLVNKDILKDIEILSISVKQKKRDDFDARYTKAEEYITKTEVEKSIDLAFTQSQGYQNMLFRMFVWRDMLRDLIQERAWWGVSFGKPQRSDTIEILRQAYFEWISVGWVTPHNSYFHILYRAGILGVIFLVIIAAVFVTMVKRSLQLRSLAGILLCSIFVYWLTLCNFLVFLELPYQAIPFWSLLGLTLAYLKSEGQTKAKESENRV